MIRKATKSDLNEIMRVLAAAKKFMRDNGNLTQWQGGYPEAELISDDICDENEYVIVDDNGNICACFGMFEGNDPTYEYIEGAWGDETSYVAVHRVASDGTQRGIFRRIFDYVSTRHSHIRIDTHKDNIAMQRAVTSCGFTYRGIIFVEDGTPRMAYEWSRVNKA